MKVLVTGGAGFIGSHLCERLVGLGHDVAALDNLSTGRLENIESLERNQRFCFVEGDVCDVGLMESLAQECDLIYHLAAAVGVKLIADHPVRTIETNIGGTEIVLVAANRFGRKIFLASSSEVYGKNENVPFAEDDDIVLGSTRFSRWSYACGKAIDEFLGLAFYQEYGLGVVIGRFFNTIGPRQTGQYGMVVPRFVQAALRNETLSIYGTGRQSRCFCGVSDVVEAVIGLMDCGPAEGGVFNIGSTEEITIESLADKIVELIGSNSVKSYVSYEQAYGRPIEDMMRRVPCIDRIGETTGWRPEQSLTEILEEIIESEKTKL